MHEDLVIATTNAHKTQEIAKILAAMPYNFMNLHDFPPITAIPETGQTFLENALIKAQGYGLKLKRATLADDSGLAVDALDGAPGIYSARYAGHEASDDALYTKLLREMASVPDQQRTAHFHCALALVFPTGQTILVEEVVAGLITHEPQGNNGFGYDPVFFYPPLGKTFAALTATEKNSVSHRARALSALKDRLLGSGELS